LVPLGRHWVLVPLIHVSSPSVSGLSCELVNCKQGLAWPQENAPLFVGVLSPFDSKGASRLSGPGCHFERRAWGFPVPNTRNLPNIHRPTQPTPRIGPHKEATP
jgi:hypothetical protein